MAVKNSLKNIFLNCLFLVYTAFAVSAEKYRAGFSLTVNEVTDDLGIRSVFIMPNETVRLQTTDDKAKSEFLVKTRLPVEHPSDAHWLIRPPAQPGIYFCTVYRPSARDSIRLNIFVLTPYDNSGALADYKIGRYPARVIQTLTWHKAPAGFVQVTEANAGLRISPRFKLEQFLCKQPGPWPKFLIVQEKLLQKLELILDRLAEKGFSGNTLTVMSGFRTPWYNKSLGNPSASQHCWGNAADIYVDHDADGVMDDLNRDGRCDLADSRLLHAWITEWTREPVFASLLGGLACYRRTHNHGPFVHVDVRGFAVDWGD